MNVKDDSVILVKQSARRRQIVIMKIKRLIIDDVAGINHLELSFNDSLNVICGANGIGKTTVLDIIADAFLIATNSKLKRNAKSDAGKYYIEIENQEQMRSKTIEITSFQPDKDEYRNGWYNDIKELMSFGINRNIRYSKLSAVASDPKRENYMMANIAKEGISAEDIKNWFVNRYLFVDKKDSLANEQVENYNLAIQTFSILDETVSFKTVNAQSFDIMLETQKGDVYFEYLSSGYKSCIYILLGIIKEIEFRYMSSPINVKDFSGVILIDEIDLHLHPIWQVQLISTLKIIFPNVQFILTTHSPCILQSLHADEIIALGNDEKGRTIRKDLHLGRYGLQGWTLEEILKNIMEMPTTTSKLYQDTLNAFDEAMNNEDREGILEQYNLLKEMLHPDNPLRRLLAIQVAQWED